MNYQEWVEIVPESIKGDTLWKMEAYRLSFFACDIGWYDVTRLLKDRCTLEISDQLYRSVGSISANLAEGYSRKSGKDRARFYEYALGSARESRDWYFKGRHILGEKVTQHRIALLTQVIKLLLTMIPDQRDYKLNEPQTQYHPNLDELLSQVPLPES